MQQPNIKRNYIYRLIYELLILITPFITTPYVSRVLGADGIGTYSYTNSIVTYFTLFAALGTASYGSREIARNRDNPEKYSKIFWEIELMTVLTSLACVLGWIVVIAISKDYRPYFIALTPMIFASMFDIAWFYTGHEKIIYIISLNAIFKVIGIILLFVFVQERDNLLKYAVINSLVLFIGNFSMWLFLPKLLVKVNMGSLEIKRHLKETLVYFIPTIATSIYTVLDKTLINAITGDVFLNGYYEQATKIINILKTFVFVSVNAVIGARISYLFAEGKFDEIHRRIERSMDFILLLGYGCVFGVISVARNFVPLFLGAGYEAVVPLLYAMSSLILIVGVSSCLGSQYYNPSGKRKQSAKFIILGSLVNLCLNLLMIPMAGALGATIASIIAELTITWLYLRSCCGYMTLRIIWNCSWKRVISGLLMYKIVFDIGMLSINSKLLRVILQVLTGVILYGLALLLMNDKMIIELFKMGKQYLQKAWRRLYG